MSFLLDVAPHSADWWAWSRVAFELFVAVCVGVIVHAILAFVVYRVLKRTSWGLDNVLYTWLRPPLRIAFPLLFVLIARARSRSELETASSTLDLSLQLAMIAVVTWLVVRTIGAIMAFAKARHLLDVPDNREARSVHTQVTVVGRSIQALIVLVGVAAGLMSFPYIHQVGASLLASAGIAGIVVGLAARPVLENLIAGVQIGLAQPIRLDDVVVVQGEWGKIEEITLTYVVVRIWDERRLILPFSQFLSSSFQNWTRTSSQLLGSVFIWVDLGADVERIRQAAKGIVETAPLWDKRVFVLQVTDATQDAVQLRILVSADNAQVAWDLRTYVREQVLTFIQREMPQALPQRRLTVRGGDGRTNESPIVTQP